MNTKKTLALALTAALGCSLAGLAQADKLDDIIESGKLRCAVTLDFPPMGSRDAQNNPVGFDVDYCNDLAKALDVKAEIVETPFPDRIPALVSGRADVIVASTSDTLERAKTIGMSTPYFAFVKVVLTREDTGIASYEDLKGRPVGGTAGTFEALALEKDSKAWGDAKGSFRAYQSEADTALAISQGHIDATVVSSTVAASWIKSGKYKGLKIAGDAPYDIDYVALGAKRNEYGLLNYLNLFINQQVRTGRYAELAQKWVGGTAPELTTSAVYR
ncbi:amino acid ABC transporter substrate-binding protein [Pseudomonas aeruginosa]|uniref:ABC transporter substrate-binding protein n=1 Tax=Pseudomonas aeruginosa TaxID=287 RepID=UPI0007722B8D|nr:transporter substrate-binding domain-containing protein [Pseudomonas aeruginosa]KXE43652.1 amino acid ABC transporter substrate-binding protein [Pseudomonas aeruginosa]